MYVCVMCDNVYVKPRAGADPKGVVWGGGGAQTLVGGHSDLGSIC